MWRGVLLRRCWISSLHNRIVRFEVIERQIVLKRARRLKVDVDASFNVPDEEMPVRFTISGYVKDSLTGEVLIGATITIPGGLEGTITNDYGFYSLTLKERVEQIDLLLCGIQGHGHPGERSEEPDLHFTMEKEVARLSEVTIYSDENSIIRTTPGVPRSASIRNRSGRCRPCLEKRM